ncbi:MAG: cell division topological specificity factor MinE [Peptococcaceae bacterium]|jgi:cell division topological specificity factor|nr:cell division topological specificity factor MinE [Peptococcaceae bacterium]
MLWELLYRLLGRNSSNPRIDAKERLRLVLVHDRASISPYLMNRLKEELIQAISKYMVIDEDGMEVCLDQDDQEVALIASIPIKMIKRDYMDNIHIRESS